MCKSSKLARLSAGLIALALVAGLVGAQQPAATPGATPHATPAATPKPKFGFIRFWNMLPTSYGELLLLPKGSPPEAAMDAAQPLAYFKSYEKVKPQRYQLQVVKASDPTVSFKDIDVLLRHDVYVTILATEVDGKPKVELVDDTYDPTTTPLGRLTVRNFFPDSKIIVSDGSGHATNPLAFGESQVLEGIAPKEVNFTMTAMLTSGKKSEWTNAFDFNSTRRASVTALADPYGRFRPRFSPDGPSIQDAIASPPGTP